MSSVRKPNSRIRPVSTYGVSTNSKDMNKRGKNVKKVVKRITAEGSVLKEGKMNGLLKGLEKEIENDNENENENERNSKNSKIGKNSVDRSEGEKKIGGGVRSVRVYSTPKSTTNSRARRSEQRKISSKKNSNSDDSKINENSDVTHSNKIN